MADVIGIRLEGVEQVLTRLTALDRRMQRSIVRKAVRAGGSPFVAAARAKAPVRNRLLKRSLAQLIRVYNGAVVAVIGQEKTKRFLNSAKNRRFSGGISGRGDLTPLHLVEEPVRAHEITGRRNKVRVAFKDSKGRKRTRQVSHGAILAPLAIADGSSVHFRQRARHPGHKGRHFVRAAYDATEKTGLSSFETKLVEELIREA